MVNVLVDGALQCPLLCVMNTSLFKGDIYCQLVRFQRLESLRLTNFSDGQGARGAKKRKHVVVVVVFVTTNEPVTWN